MAPVDPGVRVPGTAKEPVAKLVSACDQEEQRSSGERRLLLRNRDSGEVLIGLEVLRADGALRWRRSQVIGVIQPASEFSLPPTQAVSKDSS